MIPGTIPAGAAIRLFDHGPVLGIAEGVETALAAASLFGILCWAAINSTLLAKWEPPPNVETVIVFGDSDASFAGQAAAYALAHRLSQN
ncbi:toprim domain-containing protein [Methylobacterium terricola]|uniref:toprim domain-containing protein n=1 Tax=Methylobacterium terricola TaxID=2583531 RepID=UPI001FECF302|nr:toprim domain-containing protein [Methylobacterium terricola]